MKSAQLATLLQSVGLMQCSESRYFVWRYRLAALPLLAAGCAQLAVNEAAVDTPPTAVSAAQGDVIDLPAPKLATLPAPTVLKTTQGDVTLTKQLPIGLDTVLRLAEDQNAQMSLARARVNEAYAEKDLAQSNWLPNIYMGPAFYRHEGGIQDFQGNLVHSSFGSLFGGMEVNSRFDVRRSLINGSTRSANFGSKKAS